MKNRLQTPPMFEALEARLLLDAAPPLQVPTEPTAFLKATTNIEVSHLQPLDIGDSWNYTGTDSFGAYARSASISTTQSLHGVTAFKLGVSEATVSGAILSDEFLTSTSGLALHQFDLVQDVFHGILTPQTETYAPLVLLPARVNVGQVVGFSGGYTGSSASGTWSGWMSGSMTVAGWQAVTTAAGTFEALSISMSAIHSRSDTNGLTWVTISRQLWLAEKVGRVKETWANVTTGGGQPTRIYNGSDQLTSYFVQPQPWTASDYVNSLYDGILRRPADSAGLLSWSGAIAGGASRAGIAQSFLLSAEFETNVAAASRMYVGFFNRAPDPAGLSHWAHKISAGTTLANVALGFAGSPEWTVRHGTVFTTADNTNFVRFLYTTVLGRIPDESPANNEVWPWVVALNGGLTRQSLMAAFTQSAEFVGSSHPRVYATSLGMALLGRSPSPGAELAAWTGVLTSGGTLRDLAQMVLSSAEYNTLHPIIVQSASQPLGADTLGLLDDGELRFNG